MKKKMIALVLAGAMLGLTACGNAAAPAAEAAPATEAAPAAEPAEEAPAPEAAEAEAPAAEADDLVAAAQADGSLTVYGSCEEAYLSAACQKFEELYGIHVDYQRLSTGEVYTKIEEEAGNPSGDVWFGGTTDPYNEAVVAGLLEPYDAKNASHLISDTYKDKDNNWFGIYKGILGFMVNKEELDRLGLQAPKDWDDLLDPSYKGLIGMSNPSTAGTAKLIINTMVQMKGHDAAMEYFKELDKNVYQYTKSGSGPSKMVGPGECVIGIGFLHDGITQILSGYDNIELIIPASGTSFEIGATAIFKGAKHPNAAKLWIEYALSPDCVNIAKENESYQFLVIDNATQPEEAAQFGLDPDNVIDYDFEDAKANTATYVEDFFAAVTNGTSENADSSRFLTE
ncbi:MAG: ABC transporter substrate-binding protein [Lachnospiraceae bacterium]|nr:ABC transporter substrate-binding protein [Lachnospiraceae bacterium]